MTCISWDDTLQVYSRGGCALTGAEYKLPRGEATKNQLLRAAEELFAERIPIIDLVE